LARLGRMRANLAAFVAPTLKTVMAWLDPMTRAYLVRDPKTPASPRPGCRLEGLTDAWDPLKFSKGFTTEETENH
jgi:hypothetical protein